MVREQVLALDIAAHPGYFSMHGAGTWNVTESRRRNGNKMQGSFRETILEFIQETDIK